MLERMEEFFKNRVDGYDEHMLTSIQGADEFYLFTASLLPREDGAAVLDLGCGTGLELEAAFSFNPGMQITGIDCSKEMLERLEEKFPDKSLNVICGSYFDVEWEPGSYDAAVSVESLHHFTGERKLSLYQKIRRSLKSNGYFVLTDYFAESDALEAEYFQTLEKLKQEQGISDDSFYHYDTPLTVDHETAILRRAGFSEVTVCKSWGATSTVLAKC